MKGETVMAEATSKARKHRRTQAGFVIVANKTPKTIRVQIQYLVKHPIYGKFMRRQTVLTVHDEKQEAKVGDKVEVMQCRPISKTKTWRLMKVVEAAKV